MRLEGDLGLYDSARAELRKSTLVTEQVGLSRYREVAKLDHSEKTVCVDNSKKVVCEDFQSDDSLEVFDIRFGR